MHEASIVQYALNAVTKAAVAHNMTQVTEITLVIGKLKVAIPDLLRKSYNVLITGTMCEGARLIIEEKDVVIHCRSCGCIRRIDDMHAQGCPVCGGQDIDILQGNELLVARFKGH